MLKYLFFFLRDTFAIITLVMMLVILANAITGCASSRHNTTYTQAPPDYIGRQAPNTVP